MRRERKIHYMFYSSTMSYQTAFFSQLVDPSSPSMPICFCLVIGSSHIVIRRFLSWSANDSRTGWTKKSWDTNAEITYRWRSNIFVDIRHFFGALVWCCNLSPWHIESTHWSAAKFWTLGLLKEITAAEPYR